MNVGLNRTNFAGPRLDGVAVESYSYTPTFRNVALGPGFHWQVCVCRHTIV